MNTTPAARPTEFADRSDAALFEARLAQVIDVREHGGEAREGIEAFIRDCFASAHGAQVGHFMPRLFSLRSKGGGPVAAFGLRAAGDTRLFLETYLDRPIEEVLQSRLGANVRRAEIVEVGNLSALYAGAARWLIVAVTAMLYREGYRWVVFTGTSALRNGFARLGLCPLDLGAAAAERLPAAERAQWGRYYEHAPRVMAGEIAGGYRSLLEQRGLTELLRAGIACVEAA